MAVPDTQIGENLAKLRRQMSQKDLADAMRELGWKWSQATVWSVEKGERPLRLAEAEDVAKILGIQVYSLTNAPPLATLELRSKEVVAAAQAVKKALREYRLAQYQLANAADRIVRSGENVPFQGAMVERHLRTTPEELVKSYRLQQAKDAVVNAQISANALEKSAEIHESLESRGVTVTRGAGLEQPYVHLLFSLDADGEHPEAP